VPVYGATECLKIHPSKQTASLNELTAQLLKPWPADAGALPFGTEIDSHVLDLTPAALLTGLITEQGILAPSETESALARLRIDLDIRSGSSRVARTHGSTSSPA
jgi:translation initiation factor 2B subunit (eIF-2B alpha/beta/delta family)